MWLPGTELARVRPARASARTKSTSWKGREGVQGWAEETSPSLGPLWSMPTLQGPGGQSAQPQSQRVTYCLCLSQDWPGS